MKEISLTQGKVALVDDADFEWLSQWKWYAHRGRYTYYAGRWVNNKKPVLIAMHRQILGLTDSEIWGDHRDHNGLNNQRYNLRHSTPSQNCINKRIGLKGTTSKYRGVRYKSIKRTYGTYWYWCAVLTVNRKKIHIGTFSSEEAAAKAYDDAAKIHHGEFANLNFPIQNTTRP